MATKQTKENLDKTFVVGLNGIFKVAGIRSSLFSNWSTILPIVLAFFSLIISWLLEIDVYKFIVEAKTLTINFLPGILGFTIAGYSLMVAFIQVGMLNKITEPSEDSNFSLYQKMSSTFAINILLQAFALVIAYSIHFIIYFDTNSKLKFIENSCILKFINIFGLLIILYSFWVSLFMIIQIVLNIFTFSQLHHYFINKEKIEAPNL